MGSKKIRVGIDLDGVIIDKPPLVPRRLLEWLFKGNLTGVLHYRFPKTRFEQEIRKFSHFYLFRPPIKKNIAFLKEIYQKPCFEFYAVSSRYSFLEKETGVWLRKRKIKAFFKDVIINLGDKQPHLFKEEQLKRLAIDIFFEDDKLVVNHLRSRLKGIKIYWLTEKNKTKLIKKVLRIFLG